MIKKVAACVICAASLLASAQSPTQTSTSVATSQPKLLLGKPIQNFNVATMQNSAQGKLDPAAAAQISATLGKEQQDFYFVPEASGFQSANSSHVFGTEFTAKGADFRVAGHHWSMSMRGYGYGDKLVTSSSIQPSATANRLEYDRGQLIESYANGPFGVEQVFTVKNAPAQPRGQALTLAFTLSGDLHAEVDAGARGLTLNHERAALMHYSGLKAFDADGLDLSAWLELAGNELRIRVDDSNAKYPLTIDPMVQITKLNNDRSSGCVADGPCDEGSAGDEVGYSVSVSSDGNTIAVGAPYAYGTNTGSGAVYIFLKPFRFGWGCIVIGCRDYVAKITPGIPGQVTQTGFGWKIALSGDGNTLAVLFGQATPGPFSGLIYVYVKPSTGWATAGTENAYLALDGTPDQNPCQNGTSVSYCYETFPSSLAINGDGSAVVMGFSGGFTNGAATGAAYVFVRGSGGWSSENSQTAKLTASDGADQDLLGLSVAISSDGSTIAAAAPQANGYAGAVYVFVQPGGGWVDETQAAKLTASSTDGLSFVGNSVGITDNGRIVVAGASGRGLLFQQSRRIICIIGGRCTFYYEWLNANEYAELSGSGGAITTLRISGDGMTIAARGGFDNPGAVYLYAQPVEGWVSAIESQKVSAADAASGDLFGTDISLSDNGSVMAVGAPGATLGSNANQGALYLFGGSAGTASASLSPTSLSFASITVGTTSVAQNVTLTNNGNGAMHVSSVVASANFTTTQNCVAAPIAPGGGTCSESVTFTPATVGNSTGTLTFTDDSGGTSGTTQQVALTGTATKATSSTAINAIAPSPGFVGQPITVTFTVTPQAGVTLAPSGAVTVKASSGQTCLGAAPSGSCSLTFTTAATRAITATYAGDANFTASVSAKVSEVIKKNPTATTVATSLTPSSVGQSVTFTATVSSPAGAIPDGEIVTFKNGALVLGTATTSGGQASFTTSSLAAGNHTITAQYAGDATFAASSGTVKQVVTKLSSTTTVTSSLNPSPVGTPVTFTATVSSTGGTIPDGDIVTFKIGATVLGTGTTLGGQASLTTSAIAAGTHTLTAAYGGDATFAASSGTVKQVVH
jgi:hypothetical protein